MRGRKPTPTVLKLLTGNPGHRPINTSEPKPPSAVPDCPAHLSAVGKQEWSRITAHLMPLGYLTQLDRSALAVYCQAYGRWVRAEDEIAASDEISKTKKGAPIQNPWLAVANRAIEQMRQYLTEFGLSPSSRSRIKGTDYASPDQNDKRFFE